MLQTEACEAGLGHAGVSCRFAVFEAAAASADALEMVDQRLNQRRDGVGRRHHRGLDAELLRRFGCDRPDRRDDGRAQQVGRRLFAEHLHETS